MRPFDRSGRLGGVALAASLLAPAMLSAASLTTVALPALVAAIALACCAPYAIGAAFERERERYWRQRLRAERARARYLAWREQSSDEQCRR